MYGVPGVSNEDELKSVGADVVLSDTHDILSQLESTW